MAGILLLVFLLCPGGWAQNSSSLSECALGEEPRADVGILLDGFNHISPDDFSRVRHFLQTLIPKLGPVGPDLVRVGLVKSGRDPETEFDLNSFDDLSSVVDAVSRMSQSPPLPGGSTDDVVEFTFENVFRADRGNRENVPDVLILVTDRNSSGVETEMLNVLSPYMKIFVVAVKVQLFSRPDMIPSIVKVPDRQEVFTVEEYNSISNISRELTQSFCRWLKEKLGREPSLRFTDVQPRRARASWDWDSSQVPLFLLRVMMADGEQHEIKVHQCSTEILHLRPNTSYTINVMAKENTGLSHVETRVLTTPPDGVRLSGGPSRCSGSVELMDRSLSGVCGADFGLTEAAVVCAELDCGAVSELHQGAPSTAVRRSFHCDGAETSLKECESSETNCSTVANLTCSDEVLRFDGFSCAGFLYLRHKEEWRAVVATAEPDLDFASVLCEQMGCGSAHYIMYHNKYNRSFWRLERDCVKQRSGLKDCLDQDPHRNQTEGLVELICSEMFPVVRTTVSSEPLSLSWRQRVLLKLGENFTVSCSLDRPFYPGQLHLLSPTGNYNLPPVNHFAHFLFQAFSPAHTGNYTCLYCVRPDDFDDCIKSTTLYITPGAPDSLLLIRAAIFVLTLFLWTSALWLYYKGCGRQKKAVGRARHKRPSAENNTVQMVSL